MRLFALMVRISFWLNLNPTTIRIPGTYASVCCASSIYCGGRQDFYVHHACSTHTLELIVLVKYCEDSKLLRIFQSLNTEYTKYGTIPKNFWFCSFGYNAMLVETSVHIDIHYGFTINYSGSASGWFIIAYFTSATPNIFRKHWLL